MHRTQSVQTRTPSRGMPEKPSPSHRSPLKQRPLRQAGQSGNEKLSEIVLDALGDYFIAAMFSLFALVEWLRVWRKDQFHPWLWSAVAVIAVGVAALRIIARMRVAHQHREGRDGEQLVAERLEELRSAGFQPLHDLIAGDFNIDHVLIGPSGIFAVETKTLGKRGGAEEKAVFDGKEITICGKTLPRNPVAQACANAAWLRDFLRESTGHAFPVTPVVMLPGWYVSAQVPMRDILVLNAHPSGLQSYIVRQPERLPPEDIALVKTHLSMFIRKPWRT